MRNMTYESRFSPHERSFDELGIDPARDEIGVLQYFFVELGGCLNPFNSQFI
jgi:hypothetical protein